jgi:hypothetical protein
MPERKTGGIIHYITISQCPRHSTVLAITFDSETGGMRVTSDKCCGEWRVVKRWPLIDERIADIARCLRAARKAKRTNEVLAGMRGL